MRKWAKWALPCMLVPLALWAQTLRPASTPEGVRYLSGGVGVPEREQLSRLGRGYPLKLIFADRTGHYLCEVRVRVVQDGRKVAEVPSAGPWLYLQLPPGRYTIHAVFRGRRRTIRSVRLRPRGQVVRLIHF